MGVVGAGWFYVMIMIDDIDDVGQEMSRMMDRCNSCENMSIRKQDKKYRGRGMERALDRISLLYEYRTSWFGVSGLTRSSFRSMRSSFPTISRCLRCLTVYD